jgi:hypothetical protein
MATQLFKEGERPVFVEPEDLTNMLAVGWLLEDPTAEKKLPPGVEILNPKEPDVGVHDDAPPTYSGPFVEDEIVVEAKTKVRKKPGRKPRAK